MTLFKKSPITPNLTKLYTFFLIDLRKGNIQSLSYHPSPSYGGNLYVFPFNSMPYQVALDAPLSEAIIQECSEHQIAIDIQLSRWFYLRQLLYRAYESIARRVLGLTFLFLIVFMFVKLFVDEKLMISRTLGISDVRNDIVLQETFSKKRPPSVKFSDVIGLEQGKKELMEVIDFIKSPDKYQQTGARLPLGVLLTGKPGTGKTLLAKAFAGEANIPFYAIAGAAFDEIFVGVGAERVKALFEHARTQSPCVIFIDEIDAIGGKRTGGNSISQNQTLTQLLSEMDGFDSKKPVIIFAATNRPSTLDPALTRPGRFDRTIETSLPNAKERLAIFKYYIQKKGIPFQSAFDLQRWVHRTSFMSPADLEALLNEAGLYALRDHQEVITDKHFEEAFVRVHRGHRPDSNLSSVFREKKALLTAAETLVAWEAFKSGHTHPIRSSIFSERQGITGVLLERYDYETHGLPTPEFFKNRLKLFCTESVISGRYRPLPFNCSNAMSIDSFASWEPMQQAKTTIIRDILGCGLDAEFGDALPELQKFEAKIRYPGDWLSSLPDDVLTKIEQKTTQLLKEAQEEVFNLLIAKKNVLVELQKELLEKETLNAEELKAFFKRFSL